MLSIPSNKLRRYFVPSVAVKATEDFCCWIDWCFLLVDNCSNMWRSELRSSCFEFVWTCLTAQAVSSPCRTRTIRYSQEIILMRQLHVRVIPKWYPSSIHKQNEQLILSNQHQSASPPPPIPSPLKSLLSVRWRSEWNHTRDRFVMWFFFKDL